MDKLLGSTFFRYGLMAVVVVSIEVGAFWVLNSPLGVHYLVATNLSLFIGILLNWVGSRYFVFGASKHTPHKEFTLVFVTSLAGVVLQSSTVYFVVEIVKSQPLAGKVLAIVVTFFWNYLIRKHYIYKT